MREMEEKILLIQLRAIGDVLLTTPLVRAVKKHYPESKVDFLANPAPAAVLAGNPYVNEILIYPYEANDIFGALKYYYFLRKKKYDIVIDVLGTPGTAQMAFFSGAHLRIGYDLPRRKFAYNLRVPAARADIYNAVAKMVLLEPVGVPQDGFTLDLFLPEEALEWADRVFEEQGWQNKKVIAVAPAHKRQARRWLPNRFAEVAQWLQDDGNAILMTWGPGERDYVERVTEMVNPPAVLSPETSLMQLAALLQKCSLLVCNCGGTKHFSVAVGTPTLSINGASNPVAWTPPDDPRHQWIEAENVDCLHCVLRECMDLKCMEEISAQQVIDRIKDMNVL